MMVQNMDIVIVISFIMLIEVSVVVSAFSSFRSITTVSPGLVNLYKAQVVINVMIAMIRGHHFLYQLGEPWCLAFTGVPVLTLTLGGTKARRGRQVSIIIIVRFSHEYDCQVSLALAERGTGFALWREVTVIIAIVIIASVMVTSPSSSLPPAWSPLSLL